jgi:hypothetical protein
MGGERVTFTFARSAVRNTWTRLSPAFSYPSRGAEDVPGACVSATLYWLEFKGEKRFLAQFGVHPAAKRPERTRRRDRVSFSCHSEEIQAIADRLGTAPYAAPPPSAIIMRKQWFAIDLSVPPTDDGAPSDRRNVLISSRAESHAISFESLRPGKVRVETGFEYYTESLRDTLLG